MKTETVSEKVARVLRDKIEVVPYDPRWPAAFEAERCFLRSQFPANLLGRIELFGSTAVPGLAAKPIVDMLVEVSSLERARVEMPPVLEPLGYDYFWRPSHGDDGPPWYVWFIKRDAAGRRTHHLHCVESHFEHWERLLFRDYLRAHPETAAEYRDLKLRLAAVHAADRIRYTAEKTAFIVTITRRATAGLEHGR